MYKKTITFKDFNDNTLTEDFYFNLSKSEIAELEIGEAKYGGLSAVINQIIAETDGKKILEILNDLIKKAYGVKSPDGRRFIKNDEVWEDFYHTDAHSEMIFEVYTKPDSLIEFFKGAAPDELTKDLEGESVEGMSAEEIRAKAIDSMQGHKPKGA